MDQTKTTDAANRVVATSTSFIARQVDSRARSLGDRFSQTARDLEAIADQLRQSDTISSAAQVATWAARYISSAGTYLTNGNTDRFITDFETVGRERPWTITASAAVLGFAAARVLKSSSARRLRSDYGDRVGSRTAYGNNYAQYDDDALAIVPNTSSAQFGN